MHNLAPDPAPSGVMLTPVTPGDTAHDTRHDTAHDTPVALYGPAELAALRAEAHRLEAGEVAA